MGCVDEIVKKYFDINIDKYKNTMQHSAKNSEVDIWRKTMIFHDKVHIFWEGHKTSRKKPTLFSRCNSPEIDS